MTISDPIADMLTIVRNAGKAKLSSVDIPWSKFKTELADILKSEGFIRNHKFIKDENQGVLRVFLKYGLGDRMAIWGLKRISKPSRRVYIKSKDVKPILNGMGVSVISTSKGLMTDKQAKKENLGGEFICNIW